MLVQSMFELIGNTPLVEANRLRAALGLEARLLLKVEYFNPAGSVKDRVAYAILEDARERGVLHADSVIIEPTSGNTGVGLAAAAAALGLRAIFTMPETMSVERRKLLTAYGAEVVLTDGKAGMTGAMQKADELVRTLPQALLAGQFVNPANPRAHYLTTGPELYKDTDGRIDAFVAGVGTGGTLTGVGRYLKEKNPQVAIIAVEPADSPVLSGGEKGAHGIQGIGAGFVPDILEVEIYDRVMTVTEAQAIEMSQRLAKTEGLLCGISSGAALYAAAELCKQAEYKGKTIVALLPDGADRYYSTKLFDEAK